MKLTVDKQTSYKNINIAILMVCVCALAVLACLLVYRYDNKYTSPGPRALEGTLLLDDQALEQYPVLMLVDGWEFYNGALLSPGDFDKNPPEPFEYIFIGQYGGFDMGHKEMPPHGSATYRLLIRIPDEPRSYMLELPEIFSAYHLYINGREAAGLGDPAPQSYRPALGNRTVSFEAGSSIELIFAVSDFTHFYSGLVYPPAFGEPAAVSSMLNSRLVFRSVLCSIVFVIGLLSLLIGALSKKTSFGRKALSINGHGIIFALLCLCFIGYAGYPILKTFVSGYYPWYALENISYNAMIAIVMLLQAMVCGATGASPPREQGSGVRAQGTKERYSFRYMQNCVCNALKAGWRSFPVWLGIFACLAAIVVHALLPLGNLWVMLAYSTFLTVYVWVFALFITVTSCLAAFKGAINSKPLLCGALIFDCAMVMDRLLPLHEPIITGWFHELAGFMLVATIGIAIGKELAAGYRESAVLSEREDALEKLAGMQQSYYRVLEEKAAEVNTSRHDLRHHYMIIAGFIKDRRYAELEAYISGSLIIDDESGPRIYCSNNIVNVLANHYAQTAEQNGIHFEMRCDAEGDLGMSDSDLCGMLGNLFENAIDACLRIETGQRFIRVSITAVGSLLTIRFWNSTSGDVRQTGTGFLSSKRQSGFGYGLESVRSIAERYGGEARFVWDKATRTFDSAITLAIR